MMHKFSEHRALTAEYLREQGRLAEQDMQSLLSALAGGWARRLDQTRVRRDDPAQANR